MTTESHQLADHPLSPQNSISIGSTVVTSPPFKFLYPYREVRLSDDERLHHVHVVGSTGTGKSHALKHMIAQDIQHPRKGVMVLSRERGFLKDLVPHIPPHRRDDLVYVDERLGSEDVLSTVDSLPWHDLVAKPHIVFLDLSDVYAPLQVSQHLMSAIDSALHERSYLRDAPSVPAYYMYIDPFETFNSDDVLWQELFGRMRKHKVGLTVTHQTMEVLSNHLRSVVMDNIKTVIVMQASLRDARFFASALKSANGEDMDPTILQNLQRGQAIVRLEAEGATHHCVAVQIPRVV